MKRINRLVISHRPYAVRLDTLTQVSENQFRIKAAWFRRRNGRTIACLGELWDLQRTPPVDAHAFLAAHDDGRYGGDCDARWDGQSFWSTDGDPTIQQQQLVFLRDMLAGHPNVPTGHDGWWVFPR